MDLLPALVPITQPDMAWRAQFQTRMSDDGLSHSLKQPQTAATTAGSQSETPM
jgi:hypothetical protein